jgi:hypothetical protein
MIRRCSSLILASAILTGLPSAARAQSVDSAMRVIRARYERINAGSARYQSYQEDLDSLGLERWASGHGHITAAFEGDTLRMIAAEYSGREGHPKESYYFWAGAPIEIRVRLHIGAGESASSQKTAEQRYYFDRGYLVRWADPGHTIHPLTTGAVFARAMRLLADATRLVDAAHRMRDHNMAPATPAEIADAMRRELRGLMVAEMEYYAEAAKYSNNITTIGYKSESPVELTLLDVTDHGWTARATATALPGKSCVVYLGLPKRAPKTARDHVRPGAEREVACDKP